MKKVVLLAAFLLFAGSTFGQTLPKGTLIGTHVITITLNPGVTMEQYLNFFTTKFLPEFNKLDPDWQLYLTKGIRGSINSNSYGLIHVIKSDQVRSKYMNKDGTSTEVGISFSEKLNPVNEELEKLGTSTSEWTDWIVQ